MLVYENESYKVRSAIFRVYKELGSGHKEIVYQKALYLSLLKEGLDIEKEKRLPVMFENESVGVYVPDFLINKKFIVELKAKPFITKEDRKQFWQYLKGTDCKLGFLVNFGKPGGVEIIRRVYDTARQEKLIPRDSA
jgi:GxxExxY protein